MKIAITGANGFVGQHLCAVLTAAKHEIIPITRTSHGDFEKITDWADILAGCDAVIHLAARVHRTNERTQDEAKYERANVTLTQHILDDAIKAGVSDFIFLSSAAVYGCAETPASEDAPLHPQNAYGRSKEKAERIIIAARDKIRPVILRAPLIYGPDCRANFMTLAKAVRKHIPLPLGAVKNARSFLYIENLCAFIAQALSDPTMRGAYNLADKEALSTPDLIRTMAAIMGTKPILLPFPPDILRGVFGTLWFKRQIEGLTGSFLLDCSKAHKAGWTPPFTTQEGLKRSLSEKR